MGTRFEIKCEQCLRVSCRIIAPLDNVKKVIHLVLHRIGAREVVCAPEKAQGDCSISAFPVSRIPESVPLAGLVNNAENSGTLDLMEVNVVVVV